MPFHCPLPVMTGKAVYKILMFCTLYVIFFFPLATFKFPSLSHSLCLFEFNMSIFGGFDVLLVFLCFFNMWLVNLI